MNAFICSIRLAPKISSDAFKQAFPIFFIEAQCESNKKIVLLEKKGQKLSRAHPENHHAKINKENLLLLGFLPGFTQASL